MRQVAFLPTPDVYDTTENSTRLYIRRPYNVIHQRTLRAILTLVADLTGVPYYGSRRCVLPHWQPGPVSLTSSASVFCTSLYLTINGVFLLTARGSI